MIDARTSKPATAHYGSYPAALARKPEISGGGIYGGVFMLAIALAGPRAERINDGALTLAGAWASALRGPAAG